MTDGKAFKGLIRELTEINSRLDSDPPPVTALDVVGAFFGFLSGPDAPAEATRPVGHAMSVLIDAVRVADHGNCAGRPKPIPGKKAETLGVAAAAVTALKKCGWSVADAVKKVSKETKIDHSRLKSLRDNIHRGRANPLILDTYQYWVVAFAEDEADEDSVLTQTRRVLRSLC